jgi:DNA-binding PadR family transcriptional regulator
MNHLPLSASGSTPGRRTATVLLGTVCLLHGVSQEEGGSGDSTKTIPLVPLTNHSYCVMVVALILLGSTPTVKEIRPMKFEYILLGVLLEHPSTGYDLKKFLVTQGRFMRSNTQMSQVYRSLGLMEKQGLVAHTVDPRPGAQDAKTYRVTDEGAAVFLEWLTGPYQPPTRFQDPELKVRLSFAGFMSPGELISLLDVEIQARQDEIARYRHRDRRESWNPTIPFNEELAEAVKERLHRMGSAAMDAHVGALIDMRSALMESVASPRSSALASPHS